MLPLLVDLLGAVEGIALDLGCGEGQGMRAVAAGSVIGCDLSRDLLKHASLSGPVVRCRLPDLGWLVDGSVDAAFSVLVTEHLPSLDGFFEEAVRVVGPGGSLVVIVNHPAFTAPGAGPIMDQTDGEILWRWGPYFAEGSSVEPAGAASVTFHHRPLGSLLNAAAAAGWALERFEERPLGPAAIARDPLLAGQDNIPRLLGVRWAKR